MAERSAGRDRASLGAESGVGRRLEREFYQDLLRVIQKWERAFAALEENEQRRIVAAAAESGLLQTIQMARAAVQRYEQDRQDG